MSRCLWEELPPWFHIFDAQDRFRAIASLSHPPLVAASLMKLCAQAAATTSTSPIVRKIRCAEDIMLDLPFRSLVVTLGRIARVLGIAAEAVPSVGRSPQPC